MSLHSIYLDREQCPKLEVSYMNPTRFVVTTDALLRTKHGGYDQATKKLLDPLEDRTRVLEPSASSAPGWFVISGWACSSRTQSNAFKSEAPMSSSTRSPHRARNSGHVVLGFDVLTFYTWDDKEDIIYACRANPEGGTSTWPVPVEELNGLEVSYVYSVARDLLSRGEEILEWRP